LLKNELESKENKKLYKTIQNCFSLLIKCVMCKQDMKVINYLLSIYIKRDTYSDRYTILLLFILQNHDLKMLELFFKHGFNINSTYTFDENEFNLFRYEFITDFNDKNVMNTVLFLLDHGLDINAKFNFVFHNGEIEKIGVIDYLLYCHFIVNDPLYYNILLKVVEFFEEKIRNNEIDIDYMKLGDLLPSNYSNIVKKDKSFKIVMLFAHFYDYEKFKASAFFKKLKKAAQQMNDQKFIQIIHDEQAIIDKYINSDFIFMLIIQHRLNDIKKIMEEYKNLINIRDSMGHTPLMYAVQHCIDCPEILDYLMKYNPNLNAVNENKSTALHLACEFNNYKAIPYLITSKNINLKDYNNHTPVMVAIKNRNYNCAKIILSNKSFKYNINLVDYINWTPIHYLINCHIINKELFELLLQCDNISENYLHYMIENNIKIEPYFSILIKHKIGIGKKQFKPNRLLDKMVHNTSFIKAIIKNGFYILENNESILISNPIIFSITNNLIDLTKSLLSHYNKRITEQDDDNKTCLFHAIDNNNIEYFTLLLHHKKIDIEERNRQGITALGYALEKQEKEKVKLLLKKYISIHENLKSRKKDREKLNSNLNAYFKSIYDKLMKNLQQIKNSNNKDQEYNNIKKIIISEGSESIKIKLTDIQPENSQNALSNDNNEDFSFNPTNNIADNNNMNNEDDNNNENNEYENDENQNKKGNSSRNKNNRKNRNKNKKNKNNNKNNNNDNHYNNKDNNENINHHENSTKINDKIKDSNTKDENGDNAYDEDENTMKHYQEIHLACFNENEEFIQLLVGEFNYDIDEPCHDGSTPLLLCLKHEKYKCINILLENNANITKVDQQGESALSYVLRHPSTKNNEVLKLFLPKIDLYQIYSPEDLIPLHYLIKYNNYQGMEMIFQHLKNLNIDDYRLGSSGDNSIQDTLLLYAIKMYPKHLKVIEIILLEGTNVNYLNKEDKNPLIYAIEQNDMDLIRLLLKYKADINFKTNTGLTPLKLSIKNNLNLIAKKLINYNT